MNTRLNITIPIDLADKLRKTAGKRGISRFLKEASEEKFKEIERKKALKELLEAPPAFPNIKDSVKWVRKLRGADEKRMKRLGI